MRKPPTASSRQAKSAAPQPAAARSLPAVIEVIEIPDRQQRQLDALRVHIEGLLADQWCICSRNPLTLKRGEQICHVLHGMLVSEGLV